MAAKQQPLEVILIRRWASYLAVPAFIVAPDGDLTYYNDAAGALLGRSFDTAGAMSVAELDRMFVTTTSDGNALPAQELPIHVATVQRRPSHGRIGIRALDGVERLIDVTALPLVGQGEVFLGAIALFWEVHEA